MKAANIKAAIKDAFEKLLEYGVAGGVAIDVSDCLDEALVFLQGADRTRPPFEAIDKAYGALYHQVGSCIIDPYTHRLQEAASQIFFAIVYLHGWRWFKTGPKGPELYSATQIGRFVSAKGNTRYWKAAKLRTAYAAGLRNTGLYVIRETEETLK